MFCDARRVHLVVYCRCRSSFSLVDIILVRSWVIRFHPLGENVISSMMFSGWSSLTPRSPQVSSASTSRTLDSDLIMHPFLGNHQSFSFVGLSAASCSPWLDIHSSMTLNASSSFSNEITWTDTTATKTY